MGEGDGRSARGAPVRGGGRSWRRFVPAAARGPLRRVRRAASYLPRRVLGTITHVHTREEAAALTFDDGPNPATTPRFLELLEAHGARGTFFVIGKLARRYPALIARIRAGGHALGNHSWDHPSFPAIAAAERRQQLRAWSEAVGDFESRLFRPPYGNQTIASRLDALRLGWTVVTWNIVGRDWTGDDSTAIAGRVLAALRPGSIVLLHEWLFRYEDARYASRDAVLEAVATVLRAATGYRFVTVPELLRLGRPNRELWLQPGQADYLARLRDDDEPEEFLPGA